jgi:hypothetical protein
MRFGLGGVCGGVLIGLRSEGEEEGAEEEWYGLGSGRVCRSLELGEGGLWLRIRTLVRMDTVRTGKTMRPMIELQDQGRPGTIDGQSGLGHRIGHDDEHEHAYWGGLYICRL